MTYNAEEFLNRGEEIPIVDVRTPAEFAQGHIPGAVNIPIFTNEERAVVGTLYKQVGKDEAVLEGLKIVGPKMADFVLRAKELAVDKQILVHCWRGGMRSGSMAWLFNTAGLLAHTLVGGYKAYRRYIRESFLRPQKLHILGGMTGSNKTDILKAMHSRGEQFVDLECLARHRGSSFGQIGMKAQPTNEQFENNLAREWLKQDQDRVLWLEDESQKLGTVVIMPELFNRMRAAKLFVIQKSKELRIRHLVEEYASLDIEKLEEALTRIERRIGGNNLKDALEALKNRDFAKVADISLNYYDKTYTYGIEKRKDVQKYFLPTEEFDAEKNAEMVMGVQGD